MDAKDLLRFLSRVVAGNGCWLWIGQIRPDGYGIIRIGGRQKRAHRVAWEKMVGPIPSGMTLDHLCRVRNCVNPTHMEPVTIGENVLRGVGRTATKARSVTCPRGHAYSQVQWKRPQRVCLVCCQARRLARRETS